MRAKKQKTMGEGDLFRARLDQILNMKHELVQLAGKIDWDWTLRHRAPLAQAHVYSLSDEGACERWVYDPYFQYFTGEEFFQHQFPHERSDLSHWTCR
jgi:IS5 family transposase